MFMHFLMCMAHSNVLSNASSQPAGKWINRIICMCRNENTGHICKQVSYRVTHRATSSGLLPLDCLWLQLAPPHAQPHKCLARTQAPPDDNAAPHVQGYPTAFASSNHPDANQIARNSLPQ